MDSCGDVDNDMLKLEKMTEHLQTLFNDFVAIFNSFVVREDRLANLHK